MLARLGVTGCPGGYEGKPPCLIRRVQKIFRCTPRYGSGLTVASQDVIVVMLKRTTASANEQKYRTPE